MFLKKTTAAPAPAPKNPAPDRAKPRRRTVVWAKRIGTSVVVLAVAAAVMAYVDQRRALDGVRAEVAEAEKLGTDTAAEVQRSLNSDWGRTLLASEPLNSEAWAEFEAAVADNDEDTLTDLQNDLRKWAATSILYPDIAQEFEQFVDQVQLSVTPEQRATLTAVIAMEQACNDLAAGRPIDTVELSRIFGLDRGDTLGQGLADAAPELCAIQ